MFPNFGQQDSGTWIEAAGLVRRVLRDDSDNSRHQRFVVDLRNGQTVLIAHNIDVADRVRSASATGYSFAACTSGMISAAWCIGRITIRSASMMAASSSTVRGDTAEPHGAHQKNAQPGLGVLSVAAIVPAVSRCPLQPAVS
jgi:hypothetical protein